MGMLLHRHYEELERAAKAAPAPVAEPAPGKPEPTRPEKKPAAKKTKQK